MFSQFDEEKHILNFFGDRKATFLDVGAWDGVELSNTRALALKGWTGLFVEPSPSAFLKLIENTANLPGMRYLNAALGPSRELRKFYLQNQWGGTLNAAMASADSRHLVAEYYVLTVSPQDLWSIGEQEGMPFEFVSLDAEWMDYEILKSCQGLFQRTELLCVEIVENKTNVPDPIPGLCAEYGFTKVVAETRGNLLLTRKN